MFPKEKKKETGKDLSVMVRGPPVAEPLGY
jgi:hypothetical protein